MSLLTEVPKVRQQPGEGRCRWFTAEMLDLFVWVGEEGAPLRFQLCWRDGGEGCALTWKPDTGLVHERIDEDARGGMGYQGTAVLRSADEDFDLALILPRFAAASVTVPAELRGFVFRQLNFDEAAPAESGALSGLTVLVTRPLSQARGLLKLLEAEGAKTRLLPLLSIRRARDRVAAQNTLIAGRDADAWIFTSANAVKPAARILPPVHWPAKLFAIGEATAAALRAQGRGSVSPPRGNSSSEGLLALPGLNGIAGYRLVIVTGEGGRDALFEPLSARGATLSQAAVYRRAIVPHDAATVTATLEGANLLAVTSGQALMALVSVTPPALRPALYTRTVVAPAERIAGIAKALGFSGEVLTADTVSDTALVERLKRWRRDSPR